jgi:hypothetical protein
MLFHLTFDVRMVDPSFLISFYYYPKIWTGQNNIELCQENQEHFMTDGLNGSSDGPLRGDFGPNELFVVSMIASDPSNARSIYSNSDTITITFNQVNLKWLRIFEAYTTVKWTMNAFCLKIAGNEPGWPALNRKLKIICRYPLHVLCKLGPGKTILIRRFST